MVKYIYIDNRTGKPIFECDADDILVADEQLKKNTGFIVMKCPFIGCEIKNLTEGLTTSKKSV